LHDASTVSKSLDIFLRRLRDPRWIPNISDYCDGRCARCAFSERCWSFALWQHEENQMNQPLAKSPGAEPGPASCEEESPSIPGWAERHGIDLNDVTPWPSRNR
jgi:hypothetical protein